MTADVTASKIFDTLECNLLTVAFTSKIVKLKYFLHTIQQYLPTLKPNLTSSGGFQLKGFGQEHQQEELI